MWSYEIKNLTTGEKDIIFGHNEQDAFRRAKNYDPNDWAVVDATYED